MKKKRFLIYFLSGLVPLLIFMFSTAINGFVPFGKELLNIFDSVTQYPGILLEYKNLLLNGNIFYSWNGGLGFNFLGTLTYYAASPLNLLCIFANQENYPYFIAIMTFLRCFLLGLSMCFYLEHKKNIKPLYIVLFSTAYALMGYTCTYYYNYLWIDSIIMLPLVIHGLDKLLDGKKSTFYIFSLTFTIIINYYIGYMICIFCLIYFIYKVINKKDKHQLMKTFIISSILAGLMGMVVIIPSFFALQTGKAELYSDVNYSGINRNALTFFYTLTSGSYQTTDQSYGPALVYSSILVGVLNIFYFFNTKYSKKEKIATGLILIFFYLSFSVNALNYAWHFFQRPIWWQSRFSFVFSFFIINIAAETLMNIEKTKFSIPKRIIIITLALIAVFIGAYFKWDVIRKVEPFTYVYLGFSILIFLETIILVDKKYFLPLIISFAFLDISINCFNSVKLNKKNNFTTYYQHLKATLPDTIEYLNQKNDEEFFRLEFLDDYTSNDGLYFGFHGINYFNSARNIKPIEFLDKLGLYVADKCHVMLKEFDPLLLSLLNIKYMYGTAGNRSYFTEIQSRIYEHPYPLSIGFTASRKIKNTKLDEKNYKENLNKILNDLLGYESTIYTKIDYTEFALEDSYLSKNMVKISEDKKEGFAKYEFVSDKDYLVMPSSKFGYSITINEEETKYPKDLIRIKQGDKIQISMRVYKDTKSKELFVYLFDINKYEAAMRELNKNTLKAKTNINGHILEGTINVTTDNTYLYTSIEHEKGMKVYVDGKEVEYDVILDALIGLELEKGKHTIHIDYVPYGLKTGTVISVIGLISSIFYLQRKKKKL